MARAVRLSQRSDALLKVAMALISPLILLGLLEGVAYLWERQQANGPFAWELVASRRMAWERHPEPGAGYTLIEPGSHYEWQGIPVDINSHGLRGPEATYAKPPGTFRVLNLGDSVAMGWGVHEEDTYGRRLERWLNERSAGAVHYEVINAGVPGWNLENAQAYLQAEGLKYAPDLILLDVTIANDIKGASAVQAGGQPAPIQWLRANTYFWPFLTIQLRWLEARAEGRQRIGVIDPPADPEKYFPLEAEAQQWSQVWDPIGAIDRLAQANHASVVMLLFPLEFQVLDEGYPTVPQDVLTARATEASIPALDLLPAFRRACQAKTGGACQLEDRYLFADVWMHPSEYGHQLTAEALEVALADLH